MSKSESNSTFVLNTLIRTGFVPDKQTSVWKSTKTFSWLGISVDLIKRCFYVSKECISNLLETIKYITNKPYIPAPAFSKLEDKTVST